MQMVFIGKNIDWILPSLIALVALVFAVWSARSASVSKKAAVRSADAADRSAQADEEMAALTRADREAAEEELRRRPWLLEEMGGNNRWRATNTGPTVYAVNVEGIQDMVVRFGEHDDARESLEQGESFTLILVRTGGNGMLVISWSDRQYSGERRTQRMSV